MASSTGNRTTALVLALAVGGVVALANPLYLEALRSPSSDGRELRGVYHAALSTAGALALVLAAYSLPRPRRLRPRRGLTLAAVATLVVLVGNRLWNAVLAPLATPLGPGRSLAYPTGAPGGELVFVELVVALGLPLGAAVTDATLRERVTVAAAYPAALVVDVVLGALVLGPDYGVQEALAGLTGLALALVADDLLGVPALGTLLVAVPVALGYGYGRVLEPAHY